MFDFKNIFTFCAWAKQLKIYFNRTKNRCTNQDQSVCIVRDMTTNLVYIDRGSMDVVEHHDDLFSWMKYNNYTHVNTV
jgi:hypothetical protein